MSHVRVTYANEATELGVKVVPGSSSTAPAGVWNGMLRIRLSAPPEKGKANTALIEFLAALLVVKARDITIISGHSNPIKQLRIAAVVPAERFDEIALQGRRRHD